MSEKVSVTLTPKQYDKLKKKGMCTLPKSALAGSDHYLMVHPQTAKKMRAAAKKGKGVRVYMTPGELEASGEGLRELLQKAGKFYQKHIKPSASKYIRKGLKDVADVGLDIVADVVPGSSKAIDWSRKYVDKGIDKFGDISGAYGIGGGRMAGGAQAHPPFQLASNSSQLLGYAHPAMWPTMPVVPMGGYMMYPYPAPGGGSFRLSG